MPGNDRLNPHFVLWPLLVGLAAATAAAEPALTRQFRVDDVTLGPALLNSGVEWLLGTASVVIAGLIALLVARPARSVLPLVAICWSVVVELTGEAALSLYPDAIPRTFASSATFALSSMLMAVAWLAARGRPLPALAAVPFAGVASWLVFPTASGAIYDRVQDWLGTGLEARTSTFLIGFTLTALVVGLPAVVVTVWQRVRPVLPTEL